MTGVVGELPEEARAVVAAEATRLGVPLWRLGSEIRVEDRELHEDGQTFTVRLPGMRFESVPLSLLGRFQPMNAALAIAAAVRFLGALERPVAPDAVTRALAKVVWPGRLERVARRPDLFYDVAHTPESARAIAQSLAEIAPLADPAENVIVFGSLTGKDVERILDALAPLARTLVVVPIMSERGMPPAEVRLRAVARFPRVVVAPSAIEGLRLARVATGPDGFTLAVGSDYLIGELVRDPKRAGEEPDLSDPGVTPPSASKGHRP
jgi:dihydrofolate synthase / folylpolyglutamate synthase